MKVLALFGPTAVGKTGVAVALAERLRERGEDPVAVNCDSIQIYRGLGILSGAASGPEQARLEHRLLSFVDPAEEFSAGRYAELAQTEIDGLLEKGRRPIVVGGTGLYLRAALSELEMRPAVPAEVREAVEAEMEERGSSELHAELPADLAAGVDPSDRKRVARRTELVRAGIEPHRDAEPLWTTELRHPTLLAGLTMDREELGARIGARVDAMVARGVADEVREAAEAGASRTARAALGFEQLVAGQDASPSRDDVDAIKTAHRRYARRQLTWMRRMEGVTLIDRTALDDAQAADRILGELGD
jgi:tRNA dimethylallyltransferase